MPEKLPTVKDYLQDDEWEQLNTTICDHEWISVKDKLPENGVKVLVLHHKDKFEWLRTDRIAVGYLGMDCNDVFIVGESPRHIDDKHNHITHWMPLPEAP